MLPLGTNCPEFELDVVPGIRLDKENIFNGSKSIKSNLLPKKPLLIMIICAHCPFVKHIEKGIASLHSDYGQKVQFLAVSSNSLITHPQDGPEYLANQANKLDWNFPYLMDLGQTLAKDLKAACTPEFYAFSPSLNGLQILRYRGQLDNSSPGNQVPVSGSALRFALDCILKGSEVPVDQKPSIGCNIKWHPGEEPDWFG